MKDGTLFDRKRFDTEVNQWIYGGQENRRYKYTASHNPLFLDLGAFKGEWSKKMITMYGGKSHMFEILPSYIKNLKSNFTQPNYIVHEFGLASETKKTATGLENQTDAFSMYENMSEQKVPIFFKRMFDFFKENNIDSVDVCKINIEGAEYDLLEHMLKENLHLTCKNIQIQFHWQYSIDNFFERRQKIREELTKTHKLTYDYYFTWENWEIK